VGIFEFNFVRRQLTLGNDVNKTSVKPKGSFIFISNIEN
jgi:hypothetical protein